MPPVSLAPPEAAESAPPPARRQVNQSCGSATAATRRALSGSASASHRSFVTVNDACGTNPTSAAHRRAPASWSPSPSSRINAVAASAERTSFHSSAGRITSPRSSNATIPCC